MILIPCRDNPGKALVTIAIGDEALAFWQRHCQDRWTRYAARHGYDIVCLTEPLDPSARASARSPSWQKCLTPDHPACSRYDRLVWVDADLILNPTTAPCLVAQVPREKIGGTDAYAFLSRDMHDHLYEEYIRLAPRWGRKLVINRTPNAYYRNFGLDTDLDEVIQCGLLVLTPKLHRAPLADCYALHEARYSAEHDYDYNLEMRPLSFEIVRRGLHHFIDQRFNLILSNSLYLMAPWLYHAQAPEDVMRPLRRLAVTSSWCHAYGLHFAGGARFRAYADDLIEGVDRPEDFARVSLG